ncbi:MAG: glycosyltransferase [Acidobacteriota bacterium]
MPPPWISVIVVSDYAAGAEKSWADLRRALRGWANQAGPPADEFLLVESSRYRDSLPTNLLNIVPHTRTLFFDADSSYELKNQAANAATGEWLAIVDADCIPAESWLSTLRASINMHPQAAAISARTLYPGRSRMERILGLLARCYVDPGKRGRTSFISGNAACFRRDMYRSHPLPEGLGAFASRIQSEAFLRAGALLLFDPDLLVIHDFEGWRMEFDIRRNHGFSTVITRLEDDRLPHARLIRSGMVAIPFIVSGKTWNTFADCLRCFRNYNVKLYELPLAIALAIVVHIVEVPGMLAAYRGQPARGTATAYR